MGVCLERKRRRAELMERWKFNIVRYRANNNAKTAATSNNCCLFSCGETHARPSVAHTHMLERRQRSSTVSGLFRCVCVCFLVFDTLTLLSTTIRQTPICNMRFSFKLIDQQFRWTALVLPITRTHTRPNTLHNTHLAQYWYLHGLYGEYVLESVCICMPHDSESW